VVIACYENTEQLFKYKYLEKIGKAAKVAKTSEILLQLQKESPLSVVFQMESELGYCNLFLAPCIPECLQ